MQERETKKKMIETAVYNNFTPKLKEEVSTLVKDSVKRSIESYEMSKVFETPIAVDREPLVFHIGALAKELVENLMIIFDDENGDTKK